ncbi:hypothetical protein ACA910_001905 [Epithemia clementina (nom. ined.)]
MKRNNQNKSIPSKTFHFSDSTASRKDNEELTQSHGSIGSHSLRKFPSTWAAEHGISQDDIEIRGRWKGGRNGRTVNRYINVEQLPTDGKVATVLCVGGPIKYKLKPNSHVTDQFLMQHVVPGLCSQYYPWRASSRLESHCQGPIVGCKNRKSVGD